MKQTLTNGILLGGLLLGGMAYGTAQARTVETAQSKADGVKAMSSDTFYSILGKTKPDQLATNFGTPDEIVSMRNAIGEVTGVVWVYKDAVIKDNTKMDANFMVVNGEFIYVSLSKAS